MSFVTEENITEIAIRRWATAHDPRMARVLPALVKHLHAFAREVQLTPEEWIAGIEFLTATGKISDDKRQEFILASDVLGLSMLVVMMNGRLPQGATPPTVLGPFHIEGSPPLARNADAAAGIPGARVYVDGRVLNLQGEPVEHARVDFWQADEEGAYEAQIPGSGVRLRAIFDTDASGRFGFWTVMPRGYAIPMDGPVGHLVERTDVPYHRPAHIHFIVSAGGYAPLTTHLFREGSDYLEQDAVFGARAQLVTPFVRHEAGRTPTGEVLDEPFYTVSYDFVLATLAQQQQAGEAEAARGR